MPSFLPGQDQRFAKETIISQQIAVERIKIEQQIQKLKCFQLFSQPLPLKMAGSPNQLVTVCAIICNLQDPVIAKKIHSLFQNFGHPNHKIS